MYEWDFYSEVKDPISNIRRQTIEKQLSKQNEKRETKYTHTTKHTLETIQRKRKKWMLNGQIRSRHIFLQLIDCFYLLAAHVHTEREGGREIENIKHFFKRTHAMESMKHERQ